MTAATSSPRDMVVEKVARIIFDHFGGPLAFNYPSDLLESEYYGSAARSIVAALQSEALEGGGEFVLVPIEPTEEMLSAGAEQQGWRANPLSLAARDDTLRTWRAMLAAAPPSLPPVNRNAVLEEAAKMADDMADMYSKDAHDHMSNACAGVATGIRALKTAPPSPDPALRQPAKDEK